MKTLSQSTYTSLIADARSLSHDIIDGKICDKVLRLNDGSIFKLFRIKRLISSARLFPYVERFQANAARLASFDIPTVQVVAVYRIPAIKRTAVHYQPLEGITLRDHGIVNALDGDLSEKLGFFFHVLHQNGIYFRSIHFGNIVLTLDNNVGLIDIADMRIYRSALNISRRIRNLRHLFRYRSDAAMLAPVSDFFLDTYCQQARLSRYGENRFRRYFNHHLKS